MKTAAEIRAEGWRHIRFAGLVRLVNERGWRWESFIEHGKKGLRLSGGHGKKWRFRMTRGCWLKPD